MPKTINYGKEFIRVSPKDERHLEYSTNDGRSWTSRCTSNSYGQFIDLIAYGKEILAITSKGIYYSTNEGRSWTSRCTSTSYGTFEHFVSVDGKEFLAQTSKGLYYSKNEGRSWTKRN